MSKFSAAVSGRIRFNLANFRVRNILDLDLMITKLWITLSRIFNYKRLVDFRMSQFLELEICRFIKRQVRVISYSFLL